MDLITHLPKTPRGHDAIMVFVDKLSKYVRFAPTTTDVHSTGAAFLFLDKVVSLFGLPKKLITDRDPRFTGNMFQAFCKMFGIQSALPTTFHPQTDGQTEKYNSVLEDLIRHYISPDQQIGMICFLLQNLLSTIPKMKAQEKLLLSSCKANIH